MNKGAPQKLQHTPPSGTGTKRYPTHPRWEAQGWSVTCPGYSVTTGSQRRTPVARPYPLLAKLLPALPSGSQDAQQKWSLGTLSCSQAGDLALEVKGSHRGFLWSKLEQKGRRILLQHQQQQGGVCRVCPVTGEWRGLFHETNCKLRSSCKNLPPCSTASVQQLPSWRVYTAAIASTPIEL